MECNIDERGQRLRMMAGIVMLIVAVVLVVLTWLLAWPMWVHIIAAAIVLSGGFCIFEARKKWCVARAMGIRTPV